MNLHAIFGRVGTAHCIGKPYALDAVLTLVSQVLIEHEPPVSYLAERSR